MDFSTALDLQDMQRELDAGNMLKMLHDDWYLWIWKEGEKICACHIDDIKYFRANDPQLVEDATETFDTFEQVIVYHFLRGTTVIEKEEN
jgi:hypothetical protein